MAVKITFTCLTLKLKKQPRTLLTKRPTLSLTNNLISIDWKQNMSEVRKLTNVEFMVDVMENSQFGALTQAFIVQALFVYTDMIRRIDIQDLPQNALISQETWKAINEEVRDKLELRFNTAVPADHALVFVDATEDQLNTRMSINDFQATLELRGVSPEEGTGYWGTGSTVSNVSCFALKPTWATCVYWTVYDKKQS